MGRLIIVENDPVRGTDTHNVSGSNTNTPPPSSWQATCR